MQGRVTHAHGHLSPGQEQQNRPPPPSAALANAVFNLPTVLGGSHFSGAPEKIRVPHPDLSPVPWLFPCAPHRLCPKAERRDGPAAPNMGKGKRMLRAEA